MELLKYNIAPWWQYVPSKLNEADIWSRRNNGFFDVTNGSQLAPVPICVRWRGYSKPVQRWPGALSIPSYTVGAVNGAKVRRGSRARYTAG